MDIVRYMAIESFRYDLTKNRSEIIGGHGLSDQDLCDQILFGQC